jgi:hypothetical protein
LTGYCWGGLTPSPNMCGIAQDLAQCPVGQPAITPTTASGCLPPQFQTVDTSRACKVRTSSGQVITGECVAR